MVVREKEASELSVLCRLCALACSMSIATRNGYESAHKAQLVRSGKLVRTKEAVPLCEEEDSSELVLPCSSSALERVAGTRRGVDSETVPLVSDG